MLLLETIIKSILIKSYNETNNIRESCVILEEEIKDIKTNVGINEEYYIVYVYSTINNSLITSINIPKK